MARIYDEFMRQRITRRLLLQGAGGAALGAATIATVGCGGGGSGSGGSTTPRGNTPAEGTPKIGGILKQQESVSYANFNPFGPGINALVQGLFVGYALYDHLWFVPTDTGEVVNFLATDVETIDAQTIKASMGEAVYWDIPPVNGRDVRASDVKASYDRFAEQIPFGFSWLQQIMDHIEVPDERTVVFHQKRPFAWFFTASNAGSPISSSIIPQEIVGDDDLLDTTPIGSGKWLLAGHDAGTNIRLRKSPTWREPGRPYLDGVDFTHVTDKTLALSAFGAKDIDSIANLNRTEQQDLQSRFGDDVVPSSDLSRSYRTLMLKNEPPFDDPEVRHGINLALNRDEIRQVLDLGDGEFCGPLPPAHKKYVLPEGDPDLQEYFRFDQQEARQRLEAAGFPFDQEFTLKYSNFQDANDLAEVVGQQLREIGLNINLPGAEDLTVWLSNTLGPGNFQMTTFTHLAYEDPSLPLNFYAAPNQMGYDDPEVQAAFNKAAETLDEQERIVATQEAQRVLIRKWAPMLNLHSATSFGARWSYYKGAITGRGSYSLFNSGVWLDK